MTDHMQAKEVSDILDIFQCVFMIRVCLKLLGTPKFTSWPSLCPLKLFKTAIWGYSQLLDKPIWIFPLGNRSHSYGNPVCLLWVCTYITYKRAIYTIAMLDYQRVITMLAYTGLYLSFQHFFQPQRGIGHLPLRLVSCKVNGHAGSGWD